MPIKEIYAGPPSSSQKEKATVVVGEGYGPLEQAVVLGWVSEEEIEDISNEAALEEVVSKYAGKLAANSNHSLSQVECEDMIREMLKHDTPELDIARFVNSYRPNYQ